MGRVFGPLDKALRVPLHTDKIGMIRLFKAFDHAVRGNGSQSHARGKILQRLVVE